MANTLIKDMAQVAPLEDGGGNGSNGGGGGGGGNGNGDEAGVPAAPTAPGASTAPGPACRSAIARKLVELFGNQGYQIEPVQGEDGLRWRLYNPVDPYVWYVTGSCRGGMVSLSHTKVLQAPWATPGSATS